MTVPPNTQRPSISEAEARLRAQAASWISWANTENRSARTQRAREKFDQRFLDQAEGDPQRAEALRKAYFASLAYKSAVARRKAREHTAAAEAAEAALAEIDGHAS